MTELRPKYTISVLLLITGIMLSVFTAFDVFEIFNTGLFVPAVAMIIYAVGYFFWCRSHILKFNTKELEVRNERYNFKEIDGINQEYSNSTPVCGIIVDGKNIFSFNRRYKNFLEFKAVLKYNGIEMGYY